MSSACKCELFGSFNIQISRRRSKVLWKVTRSRVLWKVAVEQVNKCFYQLSYAITKTSRIPSLLIESPSHLILLVLLDQSSTPFIEGKNRFFLGFFDPCHYNFLTSEIRHYNSPILKLVITILFFFDPCHFIRFWYSWTHSQTHIFLYGPKYPCCFSPYSLTCGARTSASPSTCRASSSFYLQHRGESPALSFILCLVPSLYSTCGGVHSNEQYKCLPPLRPQT